MTSLALSAQTPAAAPPFNANFYIVAATVIPVLYLALTLQGTVFERALRAVHDARRQQRPAIVLVGSVLRWILSILMAAGTVGEILAIYALYQQQASAGTGRAVLAAVIVLAAATLAQPLFTSAGIAHSATRERSALASPATPGNDGEHNHHPPEAETGKTGTED